MAKSFKFKNNNYVDSTGIVHNKTLLSTLLDKLLNVVPTKYLLAEISTNGYIAHEGFSDLVLTQLENNTDDKLVVENNTIIIKQDIKHVRVSGVIFCEGLENTAYIWGILYKSGYSFLNMINSGSYFQSVVFPAKIISVQKNDVISGKIQASGSSNVSTRTGTDTTWLLVEIIE